MMKMKVTARGEAMIGDFSKYARQLYTKGNTYTQEKFCRHMMKWPAVDQKRFERVGDLRRSAEGPVRDESLRVLGWLGKYKEHH